MKKLMLLSALFIFACSADNVLPTNTVEGKWLWSPTENRAEANTMYEFVAGIKYTSYADCGTELCKEDDWIALDDSDRIPGSFTYTFDGVTLTTDGNAQAVTFECDGGKMYFSNGGKVWRLSADCD